MMKYKFKVGNTIINNDGHKGVIESLDESTVDNKTFPSYWVKYDLNVHPDGSSRNTWESSIDKVVYNIKFAGIDDWNRPGYKVEGLKVYLGDVNKLFNWSATKEEVDAYFKENINELVIFGSSFNKGHDPLGADIKDNINLIIV